MRYSSFKLDEGYSEDTRSQSDNDTVMRTESRFGDPPDQDDKAALHNWIVSLNGAERSGMF
jgi:F-box and WD-40 domain protein 1/11